MRNWEVLTFFLLLIFACSEAPIKKIEPQPQKRLVLCELFTHIRCTYCPYAARALDSLEKEFKDSIIIIAYHRRLLGDTLSPPYIENRRTYYYSENIEPSVFFDGAGPVRTEDPNANYTTYKEMINAKRNIKPKLRLYLTDSLSANTLKLKTTIVKDDTLNQDSLRLFFVFCEDSVRCYLPGGSDSIFEKVMRLMWPDENGLPINLLSDTTKGEYLIPWPAHWQKERFQVVLFIQDKLNKEVLVSIKRRFL